MVTRREFLQASAAGAAGLWLSGCTDPLSPKESPGALQGGRPSKTVAIVGAGISALVAGYELQRAGHDVILFEARNRVGGRVLTLRTPFAPGHLAEAGAARIRPEHHLTLGYLDHFGLPTDPFYPQTGRFVEVIGGQRLEHPHDEFRAQLPSYSKILGGSDRLPAAFHASLGTSVHLGTAVAAIRQLSSGARVTLSNASWVEVDRVLVTVPLTVLDRISFEPALSAAKQTAAGGGFGYQTATRVFVRFARRFWEAGGLNGWAVTDWPEELWHATWDLPGPEGILLTYVRGDRARDLDARTPTDRLNVLLAHWEDVFPGVSAEATSAVTHSWQAEEWSRGAWASPSAIEDAQLSSEIARAEGPVHFAGEHASGDRGWMQGALLSGIRAAREVHES